MSKSGVFGLIVDFVLFLTFAVFIPTFVCRRVVVALFKVELDYL